MTRIVYAKAADPAKSCCMCRHWVKKPSKSPKATAGICEHPERYIVAPLTGQKYQIHTSAKQSCDEWDGMKVER